MLVVMVVVVMSEETEFDGADGRLLNECGRAKRAGWSRGPLEGMEMEGLKGLKGVKSAGGTRGGILRFRWRDPPGLDPV
jgi:hypothetical protein